VHYTQFPAPQAPVATDWQALLVAEAELAATLDARHGELIYIGHSLGSVNWLLAAGTGVLPAKFDRVLLVAPADPALLGMIPGYDIPLGNPDFVANIRASAKSIVLLGSDSDPWSPNGIQATFGNPLGLEAQVIEGAKHFSKDDGFGPWQGVIDWVADPEADLTLR
jgi:predicted alpha/beta hydrolase family esterase